MRYTRAQLQFVLRRAAAPARARLAGFLALLLLIGLGMLLAPASAVQAQQKQKGEAAQQRLPINVTSDRMEVNNRANSITFLGNVIVTREDMRMTAEQLVVQNEQQTNQLQSITATGNVTITQGERRATGKEAFFLEGEEKIVLKGNARATEGENIITGEEMTLYLRTNRTVITGTPQRRVHVVFHPKSRSMKQLGTTDGKQQSEKR